MMSQTYELTAVCQRVSDSFSLVIDSLTIHTGETLCLVGPTGAGKSTLLRLLSGLVAPTSGNLSFQGRPFEPGRIPLTDLRRIATAHQTPQLLSDTVRTNVEFGLRVRGVNAARDRSEHVLEGLGLRSLAEQEARTLSGGQRQLVAIGRALVIEPEVLLLDEPTSHLDPSNVARVESLIQEQKLRTGMTVVWVTHNLFQARRMATRVGLVLSGRIIEVASTEEFFESPANERTSAFIHGKMVY
jgi:tungstate transport system ATP-binding protein